jgi:peptidoglycan/LPS O-acetylase OafA/YrhL
MHGCLGKVSEFLVPTSLDSCGAVGDQHQMRNPTSTSRYFRLTLPLGLSTGPLKTMNIAVGMMVAELHNEFGASATDYLPTPVPVLLILLGMFMAGYPQDAPDRTVWSNTMHSIMVHLVPKDADVRRYWDSLGASTVLLGIFFSKNARRLLCSPAFNFLGRVSFPVYLLHNQLIKSILTWMVYLPSALNPPRNEKGQQMDLQRGSTTHILLAVAVFYWVLYRLALWWTQYIDPMCAKIVKQATNWAYGDSVPQPPAEKPVLPA